MENLYILSQIEQKLGRIEGMCYGIQDTTLRGTIAMITEEIRQLVENMVLGPRPTDPIKPMIDVDEDEVLRIISEQAEWAARIREARKNEYQ